MEAEARRMSDKLRHKHIRTLEVLQQLVDENNAMRRTLQRASDRTCDGNRLSEGETELHEETSVDHRIKEELKVAAKAGETANLHINRITAQLAQAQTEAERSRNAEKANELTVVALLEKNKNLEGSRDATERRCQQHVERLEAEIVELREQLASTIADAQGTDARAKLDVSRLESEIEEMRHNLSQIELSRVGSAWTDVCEDDKTASLQSEVDKLQLRLRKAAQRETTAKRRCDELERQVKAEALRRGLLKRELQALQVAKPAIISAPIGQGPQLELPLPSAPQRHGRLNGTDITRKGRCGVPKILFASSAERLPGHAPEPSPTAAHPRQRSPVSNSDDASTTSFGGGGSKKATAGTGQDDGRLGSGIRRLRESEKILRLKNSKLQRDLRQSAKRLEKAESFASDMEAEMRRVAGDRITFETFVLLKRDNNALKAQLAEIKQAYSMVLGSSLSKKLNIAFADPAPRLLTPGRNSTIRSSTVFSARAAGGGGVGTHRPSLWTNHSSSATHGHPPQGGSKQHQPPLTSPTLKRVRSLVSASSLSTGRTTLMSAVCQQKQGERAVGAGALSREQ